jgi:hypothetical protein
MNNRGPIQKNSTFEEQFTNATSCHEFSTNMSAPLIPQASGLSFCGHLRAFAAEKFSYAPAIQENSTYALVQVSGALAHLGLLS